MCAHFHVQLLLSELVQKLSSFHQQSETFSNSDPDRSAYGHPRSHWRSDHAELQRDEAFLCSTYQHCHFIIHVFEILCEILCEERKLTLIVC